MEITVADKGDIKLIYLIGSLDTNTSPNAEAKFKELLDGNTRKIVVNLEQLEYISSSGLRVLLWTAKKLKASGGDLRLCHSNDIVQEVFDISGFSSILNIFQTEEEARANF
jgi:anti-sigma B factor antagonist